MLKTKLQVQTSYLKDSDTAGLGVDGPLILLDVGLAVAHLA